MFKKLSILKSRSICAAAVVAALSELTATAHGQVVTYTGLDLDVQDNSLLTAIGLNASDQVVGYTTAGSTQLPFVYTPHSPGTGFTTIPGIPSSSNSKATGINNAGLIVGNDGVTGNGFVYAFNASSATEVTPIAGSTLTFSGVNNNGIAVGTSSTAAGGNTVITYNVSSGLKTDVGTGFTGSASSNYSSYASAINDKNMVLGLGLQSSPTNSQPAHFQPFIATPNAGSYSYTNVGNAVEAVIPQTGSYPGYEPAQGLSLNGDVTGTNYGTNAGTYNAQFYSDAGGYLYNGSTGTVANLGYTAQSNAVADVNGVAEAVGTVYTENYTGPGGGYVHGFDAYAYTSAGGMVILYNAVPHYTLSNAVAVNSAGDILATGYLTGDTTQTLRYLLLTAHTISSITYTGAVNGVWDTTTANFTPANYANGVYVNFDDTETGPTTVNIPSSVTPAGVTFNNSSKSYLITGASIAGASTTLTLNGSGSVTFNNSNTFAGAVTLNAGSLTIGSTGSLASNTINLIRKASVTVNRGGALTSTGVNLSISPGCSFTIAPTTPGTVVLQLASINVGNYGSQLDVSNTDLIIHNYTPDGAAYYINNGYANGTWQGSGIVSSAARNDTTHLTTLGTIQNSDDGTPTGNALYGTFDGIPVIDSDTLVKYTYYGDANLDGRVDGSDYSLIDNAYLANQSNFYPATGWYDGDFNDDGVIDGSDYTLIDNAFNSQGQSFPDSISEAQSTDLIALGTSAVPEPVGLTLLSATVLAMLKRRVR